MRIALPGGGDNAFLIELARLFHPAKLLERLATVVVRGGIIGVLGKQGPELGDGAFVILGLRVLHGESVSGEGVVWILGEHTFEDFETLRGHSNYCPTPGRIRIYQDMGDSTVTKVDSENSPTGKLGQKYLASGKSVAMRLWDEKEGQRKEEAVSRDYEVVGYVLEGAAELELEGQKIQLKQGDSWVVPKGSRHTYRIQGHFKAVEATHPSAQVHGRDE